MAATGHLNTHVNAQQLMQNMNLQKLKNMCEKGVCVSAGRLWSPPAQRLSGEAQGRPAS